MSAMLNNIQADADGIEMQSAMIKTLESYETFFLEKKIILIL